MALLAEGLVEEWLNRSGFFTMRGIKHGRVNRRAAQARRGVNELDLLGIRCEPGGAVTGWHVEVQGSFRPIGYIAKLTEEIAGGRALTSAKKRTQHEVEVCARKWVRAKFTSDDKNRVREKLWPGVRWSHHLVHAVVREPAELRVFADEGVKCHPFHEVLTELLSGGDAGFSGSAGGDLAEIVGYYTGQAAEAKSPNG
ncbi:MAG TPA: hypothetical protein VIY49_33995 [Bryobacteraceae bacterium]